MYPNRELVLVTDNNYPMVVTGTKLFNTDASLNILPGQMGIFNAANHTAIDTFDGVKNIYIAVGLDQDGDGVAETIRKSELFGCSSLNATGHGPISECPEIWDFMFDCTTCEAEYGIKVQIDSARQASYFETNHLPTYPFHVITDCCGCDICTTEHNCNEIVCKIIDQINQTNNDAQSLLIKREFDFTVERLYQTIYKTTLPCVDQPCGGSALQAVVSVTINGVVYPITLSAPNSPATLLLGQIKLLENALNSILKTNNLQGKFHIYQKCTDTCYEISYNGCEVLDAITVFGPTDLVIELENPLQVEVPTNCTDCADAGTTTKTYSCGLRFIGKIFPQECGCFPPAEYTRSRGTALRVFPTTGFDCNNWYSRKVQDLQISEGQGVDMRWREYKQEYGGVGRDYMPQIGTYGRLNAHIGRIPDALTSKCVPYCQYNFRNRWNNNVDYGTGHAYYSTLDTMVAIPFADTTTKTQFETLINLWLSSQNCPIDSITCEQEN